MKEKKRKKFILIFGILVVVVLFACLLWFFWLEKLYLFHKEEGRLLEAGEKYFDLNYRLLPVQDGEVASVSLQKLYDEKWTTAFYVPKKNTLCDAKDSWVKVRREDGKNVYYTYLKCGKFESRVDHEGPVITLNGDDEIYIDRGDTYEELGISSLVDRVDGKLSNSEVRIQQEVDTSKVGRYTVTYSAYDHLRNKSEKQRTVVVLDMLNTVMKSKMGDLNYFKGDQSDNYVLFSGMLFQVVGVNQDNTTKLISAYTVGNMNNNSSDTSFDHSDLKKWLNNYFYNHLSERSKEYVVSKSSFCDDVITNEDREKTTCDKQTDPMAVGLLSVQEFNLSLGDNGVESYLQSPYMFWLSNRKDQEAGWVNRSDFNITGESNFLSFTSNTLLGVRPVLNVKADLGIIDGSGTENDPYILNDYQEARLQSKLNTRYSGEYLMYSGYLWRIMEVTADGETKVIMDRTLTSNDEEIQIRYENADHSAIYNPKQQGNIAYQIVNELNRYVNTNRFVSHEIKVPVYEKWATYETSRIDKYKVKISSPDAYELFTAKNTNNDYSSYWFMNSTKMEGMKYVMAPAGSPYTQSVPEDLKAGVKLVAYFDRDVKITSGKGFRDDPYYVR